MGFSIRECCFVNSRKACVPFLEKELLRRALAAPRPTGETSSVGVHMLLCERGWAMNILAMWQFEKHTGRPWKFTLHDDGTLTSASADKIRTRFPDCRIIFAVQSDPVMKASLEKFPRLRDMREKLVLGRKLLDPFHYAEGPRFIGLDSDLLFYRRPPEVLDWVDSGSDDCWFNQDNGEVYSVPRAAIEESFAVKLWPSVNSGLGLIPSRIMNHALCEEFLIRLSGHTKKAHFHEQTLYALLASSYGKGGLLPSAYRILWDHKKPADAISCHYVGESKWHTLYFHLAREVMLHGR